AAVVMINTGMFDFVDAVCKALAAGTGVAGDEREGPSDDEGSQVAQVASRVAVLFEQWRRNRRYFARKRKFACPETSLSPHIHAITARLSGHARMFMLAHELAHVALVRQLAPKFSNNTEINADAAGFAYYIEPAIALACPRSAFAGAVVSLGILCGLER